MARMLSESFIFTGCEPSKCRYKGIKEGSFRLFYGEGEGRICFEEGADFELDCESGLVWRTASSRIPDFRNNVLYGKERFNHADYPGFGNAPYTVYAEYEFDEGQNATAGELALKIFEGHNLPGLKSFFEGFGKKELNYLVFGDSISTGCDADKGRAYFDYFKAVIEKTYGIAVNIINCAISGETSSDGMKRWEEVSGKDFDLISIAFGMNDHNMGIEGFFVDPNTYKENICKMVGDVKRAGRQILLISPCIPNPRWSYSGDKMDLYSSALLQIANEHRVSLADVTSLWKCELEAGKTFESLLQNNINHPNNYGHYVYFKAIEAVLER